MFHLLAPRLSEFWGPFRLLSSYMVLIGLGASMAALSSWFLIPRLSKWLPRDQGRDYAVGAHVAAGKATGAGLILVLLMIPWLLLVLPPNPRLSGIVVCLILAMLSGYFDDASPKPWGEYKKGFLDLGIALLTSFVLCGGEPVTIWLPLIKGSFDLSPWLYIPVATLVLWVAINATNCSDGVDGLAGLLTLLSLFYLGGFLYIVVGHTEVADYLLVPHNPAGASWAVLLFTAAGSLAGYLWYNAEPSTILMGDAGSRYLGLLLGIAAMAAGNPFLVLVVAPVVLANGGTGLFKILILRLLKKLGFDIRPREALTHQTERTVATIKEIPGRTHTLIHLLHSVRFPLHDHCRHRLKWSNSQVLVRFFLIQTFLTPLLFVLLVKLR
ncbi:MAG: phospho-N-acetylmuramoyl-pentapeptide-transferase [Lentisphaeria bacterium]